MSEELRCSACGGSLTVNEEKEMYVCDYCGNEFPLPEKKIQCIEPEQKLKQKQLQTIKQKKYKIAIICIFFVCTMIAVILLFIKLIIPGCKYIKATHLMRDQQYLQAEEIFSDIIGYKYSSHWSQECRYLQAKSYLASNQYYEAVALFLELGHYEDSYSLMKKYKYRELKIGGKIIFGNYLSENITSDKEPIVWRVLDIQGSKALIITEQCIDCQQYSASEKSATWQNSSLRDWLTNNFIEVALYPSEQERIISVPSDNADKIFLLSINEVRQYFADQNDRIALATKYAIIIGGASAEFNTYVCSWWLRDQGSDASRALVINKTGSVESCMVDKNDIAIRPALWIQLDTKK
jgi:DNA-directed RNA polymerase subunit M/transcription elongation factor TFIIS